MTEHAFRIRKGLTVANSSASANLDPITLTIGGTVVNTTVANVATVLATTVNAATHQVGTAFTANATVVNAAAVNCRGQVNTVTSYATTSANVGANVQLTTVQLFLGNTTVNAVANSVMVRVANSTSSANLGIGGVAVGTSIVNSTALAVGANVQLTTVQLFIGNSIVNVVANSTIVRVVNSTASANLGPGSFAVGTSVVNTTAIAAGANVLVGVSDIKVGNTLVNAVINSSSITISGSTVATLGVENQTLSGGATVVEKDLGGVGTGTLTLDMGDRPHQKYNNWGAHTLAPGTNIGNCLVIITNAANAGIITTSGWTKKTGDSFTTTNGHKFVCHASVTAAGSLLIIQAMQ